MSAPHDTPTAVELVEAVREFIEGELMVELGGGRLGFLCRVSANALAMVERELVMGDEQAAEHAQRLAALDMFDDAALAAAIRRGDFDDRMDEVVAAIRASVIDKLRVANPGYADEA